MISRNKCQQSLLGPHCSKEFDYRSQHLLLPRYESHSGQIQVWKSLTVGMSKFGIFLNALQFPPLPMNWLPQKYVKAYSLGYKTPLLHLKNMFPFQNKKDQIRSNHYRISWVCCVRKVIIASAMPQSLAYFIFIYM